MMAEDIIATPENHEEIKKLLNELNQEMAMADLLRYKGKKLVNEADRRKAKKARELSCRYAELVRELNDKAAENMQEEIRIMDRFSDKIAEVNAQGTELSVLLADIDRIAREGR